LPNSYNTFFIITDKVIQKDGLRIKPGHVIALDAALYYTQPPNISYSTPQRYLLNQAISPLAPGNTGGSVPATIYGQVSTVSHSFSNAPGVAVDAAGNIYVSDWDWSQIKIINTAGVVSLFAGNASSIPGLINGQGAATRFNEPDALLLDDAGNLYVSDQANNVIREITPSGLVTTFATGFNAPRGSTIDNAGNIYVADQANNRIREITPAGVKSTFAGSTTPGFINGPNLKATFSTPTAIAINKDGDFYVSDSGNGVIRKITAAGQVSTFATGFNFPRGLRVDGTGNIYVTEENGRCLKRISPAGVVTKIVSAGLTGPIGLAIDGKGNLYLADVNAVKKVIISGYTIDKALPAGLTFDQTTGIISGTPTVLSSATNYTITAYNGGGSSTTVLNLAVGLTPVVKQPSIITLPLQQPILDASNNYDPGATSTNKETPITYTSSNPSVATITPDGLVHVIKIGVTIITANQKGDDNYYDAEPANQTLTVTEQLNVYLPDIPVKIVCDADFSANALAGDPTIPMTFASSNPAVATISDQGIIHIVGAGTTNITVSQNTTLPYYVSATPQSKTLIVNLPLMPDVSIAAQYVNTCTGSPVTFTATVNNGGANPSYQWKLNEDNTGTNTKTFTSSTLADGDVVTCACTNTDNSCIAGFSTTSNAVKLNLITPSSPTVSIAASVNGVFPGVPITFTATVSNANGAVGYQWALNGKDIGTGNSFLTDDALANGDLITCTIIPSAACSAPATSQPIKAIIVTRLGIPNAFSPNGDGINDTWNISGIADYPDCLVNIYNRYGSLLFQSKGYQQPWDGTINGAKVPVSTYYYVIDLGPKDKKIGGELTVIR
jgi:gliding motility-associated-like protein